MEKPDRKGVRKVKFSIIIPVYNCERTLEDCVNGLLNQTFDDYEIVLMDDGSKDNSFKICEEIAAKNSKVKVFHQENQGSGPARNNALQKACGDYVVFCDADDFYEQNSLEIFNEAIEKYNADLYVTAYNEFEYRNGEKSICATKNIEEEFFEGEKVFQEYERLHRGGFITAPWGKAYKRAIIVDNGICFPDLRRCQDVVFNLRYYSHVKSVFCIDRVTYNYQTPDGMTYLKKFPKDMYEINKTVYGLIREKMIEWGCYDTKTEAYLNTRFVKDAAILLRLNLQNNWNLSKEEQKQFSKNILADAELEKALKTKASGKINELIRKVLRTKNIALVNLFNKMILFYQNF